ncbi:MAG: maleylpyruvate isomerase family mycothiol-dependent enzyme [Acidimicrobiia bacterium]
MPLPREDVSAGLLTELDNMEALLRSLDADDWTKPSRCEGWNVAGVASHAVGGIADVVNGQLDGLGTPEVTQREVDERAGRSPSELADEAAAVRKQAGDMLTIFDDAAWESPAPGGYDGTLGDGVEALWFDLYMHADDIRAAIGRPSEHGDGLRASASHIATELTKRKWGPATIALDGLPEYVVNGGGGTRVRGDALAFALAATGRAAPATIGLDESVNLYA